QRIPEIVELTGAAEELVAARDELRVLLNEDLARRAEIELRGVIAEVLAVDAGPDEAAVGVDVDLGDTALGRRQVLVHVDAHRVLDRAAGLVDAIDFLLGHARAAVHDEREARETKLDLVEHVEVEGLLALELEGAVGGADRAREGVAAGLF